MSASAGHGMFVGDFAEQGFVVGRGLLNNRDLILLRDEVDRATRSITGLSSSEAENVHYSMAMTENLWETSCDVRRLAFDSCLPQMAKELLGTDRVRLWHDGVMCKLANAPETPWHQDFPYWPINVPRMISVWIALDDVDQSNGCLRFVPGSHDWPEGWRGEARTLFDALKHLPHGQSALKPVGIPLEAGSFTIHHALTFHGAFANATRFERRALKVVFFADGLQFRVNPLSARKLSFRPGDLIEGSLFPLV